jgi:hypothetical protein
LLGSDNHCGFGFLQTAIRRTRLFCAVRVAVCLCYTLSLRVDTWFALKRVKTFAVVQTIAQKEQGGKCKQGEAGCAFPVIPTVSVNYASVACQEDDSVH